MVADALSVLACGTGRGIGMGNSGIYRKRRSSRNLDRDFCKQLLLPRFGVGFMDERDLLAGDSSGNELFPDVVIYREAGFVGVFLVDQPLDGVKLRAVQKTLGL